MKNDVENYSEFQQNVILFIYTGEKKSLTHFDINL